MLTAHHVASGAETIDTCPDCGRRRSTIAIAALTDSGPVTLGAVTECGCADGDTVFRCAFCPATMTGDGREIFLHFRDARHD